MALVYRNSLKHTRMLDVVTDIDSGGAAGALKIYTSAYGTLLATFTLNYNPCGTDVNGLLTFSGMPKSANGAANGTAAIAKFQNSASTDIANDLTVGTVGTNIIIDNTSINANQACSLTAATIQHG